jgi:hypothetical protein
VVSTARNYNPWEIRDNIIHVIVTFRGRGSRRKKGNEYKEGNRKGTKEDRKGRGKDGRKEGQRTEWDENRKE